MITHEENRNFSNVDKDTPMGNLLRRYWHPLCASAELEDNRVQPIRLLGEDLVLYRDYAGTVGLLARQCPHRRADLSYGWVEECGLRCSYHGWLFNDLGECREQPFEDTTNPKSRFREKIKQPSYRTAEKAGLIWAYLGPEPAPLVPNWEPFTWSNGFVQIVTSTIPCNWLQTQENSIDPVHFEWLHDTWQRRIKGDRTFVAARHRQIAFDEFEYGFTYRRLREDIDETSELWTVGRVCLWPNALFTGGHFEWRVPIDNNNTLSIGWFFEPVPVDARPYSQETIPYWKSPIREPDSGRLITSHIMNQDFVAWIGQGPLSDRECEHLGTSDLGVRQMRKRLVEEAQIVARGGNPKAIIRDSKLNEGGISLPIVGRDKLINGPTREEFEQALAGTTQVYGGPFPFLAGQPDHIKAEYNRAMAPVRTVDECTGNLESPHGEVATVSGGSDSIPKTSWRGPLT